MTNHRHAFQSLLWNLAASERIKLYGRDGAVEGDLVFPKDSAAAAAAAALGDDVALAESAAVEGADEIEQEQEVAEEQPEAQPSKSDPAPLPSVHVVTKEDVEQGTFGLADVVLPMPG